MCYYIQSMSEKKITLNLRKLSVLGTIWGILLQIICLGAWYFVWGFPTLDMPEMTYHEVEIFFMKKMILYIVVFIGGIVVHELIHGLVWGYFAPQHFKNISFGISFRSLIIMPYCHCNAPLQVGQYRMGALAPLFILGIIPYLFGMFAHSFSVMFFGFFFILTAMGDIAIVWKMRGLPNHQMVLDHPSEPGFIIFEGESC